MVTISVLDSSVSSGSRGSRQHVPGRNDFAWRRFRCQFGKITRSRLGNQDFSEEIRRTTGCLRTFDRLVCFLEAVQEPVLGGEAPAESSFSAIHGSAGASPSLSG